MTFNRFASRCIKARTDPMLPKSLPFHGSATVYNMISALPTSLGHLVALTDASNVQTNHGLS